MAGADPGTARTEQRACGRLPALTGAGVDLDVVLDTGPGDPMVGPGGVSVRDPALPPAVVAGPVGAPTGELGVLPDAELTARAVGGACCARRGESAGEEEQHPPRRRGTACFSPSERGRAGRRAAGPRGAVRGRATGRTGDVLATTFATLTSSATSPPRRPASCPGPWPSPSPAPTAASGARHGPRRAGRAPTGPARRPVRFPAHNGCRPRGRRPAARAPPVPGAPSRRACGSGRRLSTVTSARNQRGWSP